jgi:chloride channel 6
MALNINDEMRESSFVADIFEIENTDAASAKRRAKKIAEVHHLSHGLPMLDYASLNYDECPNKPYREYKSSLTPMFSSVNGLISWLLMFLIGAATAWVAVIIDVVIDNLMTWKFDVVGTKIIEYGPTGDKDGKLVLALLILLAFNCSFVLIATLMTTQEPLAAGSGIPEVKVYLNGVVIPRVTNMKTLVVKATGVLWVVAGGLFVGREGPMIHSGAVIGAGFPQFQLNPTIRQCFNPHCECMTEKLSYKHFRNDKQKRDFVSSGAAAGVAAAFGAPIGGVLFALEEGASFWNQSLTWKSLACAMTSTAVLNFWLSGINYGNWTSFDNPGLLNFGSFSNLSTADTYWSVWDLFLFVCMGIGGGFMGALFNFLNYQLTRYRMLHVNPKGIWVRCVEAVLVASVTTIVTFTASMAFGRCKYFETETLNITAQASVARTYFCNYTAGQENAEYNQYNDMATLFFNGQETAIKALYHNPGDFTLTTLFGFILIYFPIQCWTYGILIPSGLFVPSILCGACYGRIWGNILTEFGYTTNLYTGSFALIGSAAFLGGVVRMTISLTVIMIETTNQITYGLPIMLTLLSAKFVGDQFNIGLYDIHNEMKGIPFLEFDAPDGMDDLVARDVMEEELEVVNPHIEMGEVIELLSRSTHNAWPVVTARDSTAHKEAPGNADLTAKDILNENFRKRSVNMSYKSGSTRRPSSKGTIQSGGTLAMMSEEPEDDVFKLTEAKELSFHGVILREQLTALVKNNVSYDYSSGPGSQKQLNHWEMMEDYPNYPKIFDMDTQNLDKKRLMDVSDYMNDCPYSVAPNLPAPKVFNLFRTMGLRHLPVVNAAGGIVGLITRHDLTHESMHHKLTEINGGAAH